MVVSSIRYEIQMYSENTHVRLPGHSSRPAGSPSTESKLRVLDHCCQGSGQSSSHTDALAIVPTIWGRVSLRFTQDERRREPRTPCAAIA